MYQMQCDLLNRFFNFLVQQREIDTTNFMQTSPWLGLIPGADGQILYSQNVGDSPLVTLFKSAAAAAESYTNCSSLSSLHTISKQAEAAGQYLDHSFETSIQICFIPLRMLYLKMIEF